MALITFDDRVAVEFELLEMSEHNREKCLARVAAIHSGGSTNLSGGLLRGMDLIETQRGSKAAVAVDANNVVATDVAAPAANATSLRRVESLLLFTDGEANVGARTSSGNRNRFFSFLFSSSFFQFTHNFY